MLAFLLAVGDSHLSNLDLWSLIVGGLLPLVTAVVQQPKWSKELRVAVAVAASVVASAVTTWLQGGFDGSDWIRSALLVIVASQATYVGIWKKTVAPTIEHATSGSSSPKRARRSHDRDRT